MTNRLTICATCVAKDGVAQGAALAEGLRGLMPKGWEVTLHDCLSMCDEPTALAVQGDSKATYLFAGVAVGDAADVAAFAGLYDAQADGWIADARPAGRLRFCLKGRVPAK